MTITVHRAAICDVYIHVHNLLLSRFVHKLSEVHAANETKSSRISSALACVSTASARAKTLQERIKREEVVLTEKSEACLKLLVQIGQDTAILKQHSQLLAKQKDRIAHLKKVKPTS